MIYGPKQTLLSATTLAAASYVLGDPTNPNTGTTSSVIKNCLGATGIAIRAYCSSTIGGSLVFVPAGGFYPNWGNAPVAVALPPYPTAALQGSALTVLSTAISPATAAIHYIGFGLSGGLVIPCLAPNLYASITIATATINDLVIEARPIFDSRASIEDVSPTGSVPLGAW